MEKHPPGKNVMPERKRKARVSGRGNSRMGEETGSSFGVTLLAPQAELMAKGWTCAVSSFLRLTLFGGDTVMVLWGASECEICPGV